MKASRRIASAIGVAIVAVSALALVAPANAATPGVTFVTAADIAQPGSPTTAGWSNLAPTTLTSDTDGLFASISSRLTYGFATPLDATTGTAFRDLTADSSFTSRDEGTNEMAQIPVDTGSGSVGWIESDYLPNTFNVPTPIWWATFDIGSIPANTEVTLAQIDQQIAADPSLADATILGLGFLNDDDDYYYTARINGVDFTFLPTPVVTAAPTTVTLAALKATGVTISTTGFVANKVGIINGEQVLFSVSGPGWSVTNQTVGSVDANGAFSHAFVAPASATGGSYTITLAGSASGAPQTFAFTVTRNDPAASPTLALTGTDAAAPLVAGGVLLLGGVLLATFARRRRTA